MIGLEAAASLMLMGGFVFSALGFVMWRIDRRFEEPAERGPGKKIMVFGLCWLGVMALATAVALLIS